MTRRISIRLHGEALHALHRLEASGLTRSEAVRAAIVEAAARLRAKRLLPAEVAALEEDPDDRDEMFAVADLMGRLRSTE